MSSYELSEWMAFERVNGPLGQQYSDDMAANIHEQLQAIQYILGKMSAGEESPVPLPHRLRRPHEVLLPVAEHVDPDVVEVEDLVGILAAEGKITEEQHLPQTLPGT